MSAVPNAYDLRMSLTIQTSSGAIRGTIEGSIRAFRGIPFAEPPTGDLRFAPPRRARHSSGVIDATKDASEALQAAIDDDGLPIPGQISGSEDALHLNVFAPDDAGPHPVLCCIHGGGGVTGSPLDFDGNALAQQGLVVVTIAYRLGLLGLLAVRGLFGDEPSSNFALLDQIEALRWLSENVAAFGGDPGRVTVVGQSNGARSIVNLLAAPRSRGLFQQAVIMSSTGGGYLVSTQDEARELLSQVLAGLGLPDGAEQQLRNASADELMRVQTTIALRSPFLLPFLCVVDGDVLSERPIEAVAAGRAANIRLLIGTTHDECDGWAFADPRSMVVPQDALPRMCESYRSLGHSGSDRELLLDVLTASEYWLPAVRLAEKQFLAGGKSWMYRFDFRLGPEGQEPGAAHGADFCALGVMNERQLRNLSRLGTDFSGLAEATGHLRQAIIRFAHDGRPGGSAWPEYDPDSRATYLFDLESQLRLDPDREEREAWAGIL